MIDKGLIKAILESENGWMAIVILLIYIAYKLIAQFMGNKKAKTKSEAVEAFIDEIKLTQEGILARVKTRNREAEAISRKLTIISNKYNSELSREASIIIIQNVYFNFATILIQEIDELRNKNIPVNNLISIISTRLSILSDEKIQELDLFLYKNRQLITYTPGEIVAIKPIIHLINNYASKNGMLAREIYNLVEKEMTKVIKRMY